MQRRTPIARWTAVTAVAAALLVTAAAGPAAAQRTLPEVTINGSGATFPQVMIDTCRESFAKAQPNVTVNYPNPGGGSGKGRQEFADQVTAWGATDAPYPAADLGKVKGGPFLYLPYVTAPITVAYHLEGVKKRLRFTPATLARIFQGDVTRWDDEAIRADNPGVDLPSTKITIARRADSSGTTENFTKFLTKAAGSVWKLGAGSTVAWPEGSQGGNGNSGVSSIVSRTDGAIGYVDYSDARATGLDFAAVQNAAGRFVVPSVRAATAALEGVALAADGLYDPLSSPNPKAYPITAPTWLLVYETYDDARTAAAVKAWAEHLLGPCQKLARSIDYAPIPKEWVKVTRARLEGLG